MILNINQLTVQASTAEALIDNAIEITKEGIVSLETMKPEYLLRLIQSASVVTDARKRRELYYRYLGQTPIFNRKIIKIKNGEKVFDNDPTIVNNKVSAPFETIIVKTMTGYLFGNEVSVSVDEDMYKDLNGNTIEKAFDNANKIVNEYVRRSNWDDVNSDMATYSNICGYSVKILYTEGDAFGNMIVKSKAVLPYECILFGDDYASPRAALRYYKVNIAENDNVIEKYVIEYYTDRMFIRYRQNKDDKFIEDLRVEHGFTGCPVIGFPISADAMGRFEKVISLLDAVNKLLSDISSELESSRSAQLIVKGLNPPATDAERFEFKEKLLHGQIIATSNSSGNDSVEWLIKHVDTKFFKLGYDLDKENIYSLSSTPNMTDENFSGNSSGVALSYKMQSFANDAYVEQRKFTKGFNREFELISSYYALTGRNFNPYSVMFEFNVMEPKNMLENATIYEKYINTLPAVEALKAAGFKDPARIAKLMQDEKEKDASDFRLENVEDSAIEPGADKSVKDEE